VWSETISLKGVPPVSAEPRGWGFSVSRSGYFRMSVINGTRVAQKILCVGTQVCTLLLRRQDGGSSFAALIGTTTPMVSLVSTD